MRNALILLMLVAGFVVAGCTDKYKDPDPQVMGYDYYPLEVGQYRIYNVMDIKYQFDVGDTTRFQLRERVDATFYDQTNKLNYKIVRSVRPNVNSSWVDDSVMVVSKSNTMLMLTKDNTKYVKLVFPVKNGAFWLGDAYNNNVGISYNPGSKTNSDYYTSKEPFTYESVGQPFTNDGKTYDKTASVIQGKPTETWVGLDDRKEVYAHEIGLVYRQFIRIVYCNQTESKDCEYGIGYKLQGHERYEVLASHGNL